MCKQVVAIITDFFSSRKVRIATAFLFLAIVLLFFIVQLCSFSKCKQDVNEYRPLRIGMFNRPTAVHPLISRYSKAVMISNLVFSQLYYANESGLPVSDLALSSETNPDFDAYTVKLRDDVYFHDGRRLTADDVVFTYKVILKHTELTGFDILKEYLLNVEALDDLTVKFQLKKSFEAFTNYLDVGILPSYMLSMSEPWPTDFCKTPSGSGPYVYKSMNDDGGILLERNSAFYGKKPRIRYVEFVPLFDFSEKGNAYLREEVDLVIFLSYYTYQFVEQDPLFLGSSTKSQMFFRLILNESDPVLQSEDLREAVFRSVSNEELVARIFGGYADIRDRAFLTGASQNTNKGYDPEIARSLLENEGWEYSDSKSLYRINKKKERLVLRLGFNPQLPYTAEITKLLVLQLAAVGIELQCVEIDNAFRDGGMDQQRLSGVLDLCSQQLDVIDEMSMWQTINDDSVFFTYENEEADELIRLIYKTKEESYIKELNNLINQDFPAKLLLTPAYFHSVRADLTGADRFFEKNMSFSTFLDFKWKPKKKGGINNEDFYLESRNR